MKKVQLGFIGLGSRGANLLGNVLQNFKDVDVVAVCDSYEDRAEAAAEREPWLKFFHHTAYR